MKPARLFATAILATITLCSLILLARRHKTRVEEAKVRTMLAQAHAGLEGAPDREERLRTNEEAVSEAGNALAGANDYLWVEAEQLRGGKDVKIPVDVHVEKVVFGVTGILRKPEWNLTDPQGQKVDARQQPGRQADLAEGAMLNISHPATGTWTLHVTAHDNIFIFVRAASNTGFDACEMQPDGGMDIRLSAEGLSEAQFRFFSEDGFPIGPWAEVPKLSVSSSGMPGRQQYRYRLEAPKIGPFRVGARIQDLHGHLLQRVCDSLTETAAADGH